MRRTLAVSNVLELWLAAGREPLSASLKVRPLHAEVYAAMKNWHLASHLGITRALVFHAATSGKKATSNEDCSRS